MSQKPFRKPLAAVALRQARPHSPEGEHSAKAKSATVPGMPGSHPGEQQRDPLATRVCNERRQLSRCNGVGDHGPDNHGYLRLQRARSCRSGTLQLTLMARTGADGPNGQLTRWQLAPKGLTVAGAVAASGSDRGGLATAQQAMIRLRELTSQ